MLTRLLIATLILLILIGLAIRANMPADVPDNDGESL